MSESAEFRRAGPVVRHASADRERESTSSSSSGSVGSVPVRPPGTAFKGNSHHGGQLIHEGDDVGGYVDLDDDDGGGYVDLDGDDATDRDPGGGRWLAFENQGWFGSSAEVFWDPGPSGASEPSVPLPSEWAGFTRILRPTSGMVVDGETKGKVPRSTKVAVPYARFRQIVGGSRQARSGSTYNPFGRFSTELSLGIVPVTDQSSVTGGSVPEALQAAIEEVTASGSTVLEIAGKPVRDQDGRWPQEVRATTGETLYLSTVTPVAVVYSSQQTRPDASATSAPSTTRDVFANASGLKGLMGDDVDSHSGKKRALSQAQVMGSSANDAARGLGFPVDEENRWEWLHLIAHSMGGGTSIDGRPVGVQDAQVPENLVLGTREANTEMIVAEESIKSLTKKYPVAADVSVIVRYRDAERRFPQEIIYHYNFWHKDRDHPERRAGLGVFLWSFDPMRRTEPTASGNRFLRATMSALGRSMADAAEQKHPELADEERAKLRDDQEREKRLDDAEMEKLDDDELGERARPKLVQQHEDTEDDDVPVAKRQRPPGSDGEDNDHDHDDDRDREPLLAPAVPAPVGAQPRVEDLGVQNDEDRQHNPKKRKRP